MNSSDFRHQPSPDSAPATFQLIIERGVSRFPVRPILGDRYLIGAGSNCHLQLGGDIPLLHSIIIPEEDHLWIDAVSPIPQLIVNGRQLREGPLKQGDVIVIGDFVFCVAQKRSVPQPVTPISVVLQPDAASMSAAELVDLLEQDLENLEDFERQQRQSVAALTQASIRSGTPLPIDWCHDPRASLLQLLSELHDRSRALDIREAALMDHASQLASSQEELRRQLELLCPQNNRSPENREETGHRRSA